MASSPLKVLHVTPMYPSEDHPYRGSFIKSQIESLQNIDGLHIDLEVLPGGNGIFPYLKNIERLKIRLRQNYDVVHAHYGNLASLVKLIGTGGTPVITSYCGTDLMGKRGWKDRVFVPINRHLARRDSHAIVKNRNLGQLLEGLAPAISMIPNGVDTDLFKPIDQAVARRDLGLDPDEFIILFPARPEDPNKNFAFLEEVSKNLPARIITFEGGGYQHHQIPALMSAADLIGFTSLREGSPNVIKEALACNRPILSSDVGDVEWLVEGVDQCHCLPFEQELWRERLIRAIQTRAPESKNGRSLLIQKGLDRETVALRLAQLYRRVAESKGGSGPAEEPETKPMATANAS